MAKAGIALLHTVAYILLGFACQIISAIVTRASIWSAILIVLCIAFFAIWEPPWLIAVKSHAPCPFQGMACQQDNIQHHLNLGCCDPFIVRLVALPSLIFVTDINVVIYPL